MFTEIFVDRTFAQLMAPLLPSESAFFLYLLSAFVICVGNYIYFSYREADARPDGVANGLLGYIFDPKVWLHRSAKQDYVFFLINAVVYHGIAAQLLISGHVLFELWSGVLDWSFGARATPAFEFSWTTAVIYTLIVALTIDFGIFLTHYIQHKFAPLWHFHSVHHSAEVLTIVTVYRQHPVDLFFTGFFSIVLTQAAFAGFTWLTLAEPSEFAILNVNVVIFAFLIFGYNLRHSHIWLSYPRWMSYIFISPAQHQTHHSIDEKHFDKNFGFIFSIWDWLFGTLYVPKGYEKLEFGLSREEPNPFDSVTDIYLQPFRSSWQEIVALTRAHRQGTLALSLGACAVAGAVAIYTMVPAAELVATHATDTLLAPR